jgi:multisubunit Na+/H+ antiporter MnhF subunit
MEELLAFLLFIGLTTIAALIGSAILLLAIFTLFVIYRVIRGKQKGWKLPKNIKDTHSW